MLDVGFKKVAEVYRTKPNIARAMQARVIDPVTGTLAGMHIDNEQAAALAAQAPQATVAQQVMGGLPPAPPQAPPPPSGGLGATPQAGPPMAPDMSQMAPQAMPQGMGAMAAPAEEAMPAMAEGGMVPPYASGGGLSDLPVPDTMFDEPSNGGFNDGYAGGGIVAFAQGDQVRGGWGDYFESMAKRFVPGIGVTSRQRSADQNASVGGVPNSFHITGDARDFVPPPGMDMASLYKTLKSQFGSQYDVINEGDHVHIEPGPSIAKAGLGALANPEGAAAPAAAISAPGGSTASQFMPEFEAGMDFYGRFMPERKTEARDMLREKIRGELSEEKQKQEEDYDKYSTLAALGWNMAASNAPNLLQAMGAAAAATLPGAKKDKEAREERYMERLKTYADLEGIDNEAARERVNFALNFAKTKLDLRTKDIANELNWRVQLMQDATQRFGITTQAATAMRGQDFTLDAARLRNQGVTNALFNQATRSAWESAEKELQQNPKYREEKNQEVKNKMLQDLAQQKLQVYLNMVNSGDESGGIPGLPSPDFEIDT